jgi:DNA polymerase alpha subunit A
VLDDSKNKHVSCCVQIPNIKRELYFLPFPYKLDDDDKPTREIVELKDVRQEIETILERKGIRNWTMTECQRQYASGLPDVPPKATYIKLNYSFTGKNRAFVDEIIAANHLK